jgi:hypothetical protein
MTNHSAKVERVFPALAPLDPRNELISMETKAMKILGRMQKTPWKRFVRLQSAAARLAKGHGQPKGVFRFASNEACSQWTATLNRSGK